MDDEKEGKKSCKTCPLAMLKITRDVSFLKGTCMIRSGLLWNFNVPYTNGT